MKSIKRFERNYDDVDDTLWIVFNSGIEAYAEEIAPGVTVEFGENGEVVGIEVQEYKRLIKLHTMSDKAITQDFSFQTTGFPLEASLLYTSKATAYTSKIIN